jgi:hypothetical protein
MEEASRCPECKQPGKQAGSQHPQGSAPGTRVLTFVCENSRCPREGDNWLIQVNADGTVPQRTERGPKTFAMPRQSSVIMQRARDELKLIEYMTLHPHLTDAEAKRALGG